jgi:hypothetical protein
MREVLRGRVSEKWEPENLSYIVEIDSFLTSGGCAAILNEPLRMLLLTFRMQLGIAHPRLPASLTQPRE